MAVTSGAEMSDSDLPDWIGKTVRIHRKRSGLSQKSLAELAGVGKTAVFDIEKGKPTVRLATLLAVLRTLNIRMSLESPLMEQLRAAEERS